MVPFVQRSLLGYFKSCPLLSTSWHPNLMFLMPLINTNIIIERHYHLLLPLRPLHPRRRSLPFNTIHLLRHRQLRINRRRKRVNQLRPVVIPQPEHSPAISTEIALRLAFLFGGKTAVFDGYIFLDQLLPFLNLQRIVDAAEIDGSGRAPAFTTDATCAQLVWHRRV